MIVGDHDGGISLSITKEGQTLRHHRYTISGDFASHLLLALLHIPVQNLKGCVSLALGNEHIWISIVTEGFSIHAKCHYRYSLILFAIL